MDCLEARRHILADPRAARRAIAAHLESCARCSDFGSKTEQLDAELAAVVAVPVPSRLSDEILAGSRGRFERRRRFLAAAASVIVVSGIGGWLAIEADDPLAMAGIDFVVEEEANAVLAAANPDPGVLARVAQALHIEIPRQLGHVRYIGPCPFRGGIAHHVIATTPQGKVTLLLLPDQPVEEPQSASARGLRAVVRPAGAGSITVVGESRRGIERVCSMLLGTART